MLGYERAIQTRGRVLRGVGEDYKERGIENEDIGLESENKAGKQMTCEKFQYRHLERNELATSSRSDDMRTDPFSAKSRFFSVEQTVSTRALKRTSSCVRTVFMLSA